MEKNIKHKHPLLDLVYDKRVQYITATFNKNKQLMIPKTLDGHLHIISVYHILSYY